jgi:hypothetical protein
VPKFAELVKYPLTRKTNADWVEDIWDGDTYSSWLKDESMLGLLKYYYY